MPSPTSPPPQELDLIPSSFRRLGVEWPRFTGWQWKVLIVLTLINFLNYFDRLIVFPMFPLLKEEFGITDFRLGLLGSVFIVVHSLAVLPFGFWSDRGSRQKIMAFGVFLWSSATMLSGLATTFRALLGARAVVGIGEGAYAPAGTAMISESFPRSFRARVQGVFNMGMLMGGVAGLAVGGLLSQWVGWRYAFFLVGLPGFVLAFTVYNLKIPSTLPAERPPSAFSLFRIPAYLMVMAGGMFVVFSSTAFITWGPTFAIRYHGLNVAQASSWIGGLVLVGSLGGVLVGSYVADFLPSTLGERSRHHHRSDAARGNAVSLRRGQYVLPHALSRLPAHLEFSADLLSRPSHGRDPRPDAAPRAQLRLRALCFRHPSSRRCCGAGSGR